MAWSEAARRAAALARRRKLQAMVNKNPDMMFAGSAVKFKDGPGEPAMRLEAQDVTRDYARVSHAGTFGKGSIFRRTYQDVRRSTLRPLGLPKEGHVELYQGGFASRDQAAAYLRAARSQTRGGSGRALRTRVLAGRTMQASFRNPRRR